MKKSILIDPRAQRELMDCPKSVQIRLHACFATLRDSGVLEAPTGKKLGNTNLFEIRVRVSGSWRSFYAYIQGNKIVILRIFQKKTQATPLYEIRLATRRLMSYRN
jgi:phage-related protein